MGADALIQAQGLNTSPNALAVPPGSLLEAKNVIIQRDNVVESRRGYKLYGTAMPDEDDRARQLLTYKGRILRHFGTTLEFDTGTTNLDGENIFEPFNRTIVRAGDTTNLSAVVQNVNTLNLVSGMTVTGSGIPVNTVIVSVGSTSITLNNQATATTSDVALTLSGTEIVTEVDSNHRIRSVESNGNLYITSAEGIRKISVSTASQLSDSANFMTLAGGLKAIGISAMLLVTPGEVTGFLPQDSAVAYRSVWGTRDANSNLVLGTPSERAVVYNPLLSLIIQDFMRILLAVDDVAANPGAGTIDTYGYVAADGVAYTATAPTVLLNMIDFASRLDDDIFTALPAIADITWNSGIVTLEFAADPSTIDAGDFVEVSDVAPSGYNGVFQVQTVDHVTFEITYNLVGDPGTYSPSTGTVREVKYFAITQPTITADIATDQELVNLQDYLGEILAELQAEPNANITTANLAEYITPLALTTTAQVTVRIEIPSDITSDYFLQLYRSDIAQATGTTILSDLTPNDEMRQVYEAFPTAAEIAQGFMIVQDNVPDVFRGANLYTNPSTGEGILQSNDLPPVAVDVARFQNVVFYANTSTRERLLFNMLGTTTLLAGNVVSTSMANPTVVTTDAPHGLATGDAVYINDTGSTPPLSGIYRATVTGLTTFTVPVNVTVAGSGGYWTNSMVAIVSDTSYNLYKFIRGRQEVTTVTTVADVANSLNGTYFLLNAGGDATEYYVWCKTSGGVASDPMVAGKTGIRYDVVTGDTANDVAIRLRDAIKSVVADFTATAVANVVTITTVKQGVTTNSAAGTSGFTVATTQQGRGENTVNQEVLLSTATSAAIALDETARSFVNNVNENTSEIVNAYYISGVSDVPGKMLLEGRFIASPRIYVLGSSPEIGASFDPIITPTDTTNFTNTAANPTVVTTSTPHGLVSGDEIAIAFSNSIPPISGTYTVTFLSTTTFSVPVNVATAGTTGLFEKVSRAAQSDNEVRPNRVYYSKIQQPEAVPLVNFFDVGAGDKAIIRIFALRTSLFVFKEDGLYRISGDQAPFTLDLFDESVVLLAADSLDIGNNELYGWTIQGIQIVSEAGANPTPVSRPIDVDILRLASANFPNFKRLTWGIGYNSDNSYTVYTNTTDDDTSATIGYRWSFLTKSWTTFDLETTCGVINNADDKMYMGAGDVAYLEQERKTFSRLDYADREIEAELLASNYFVADSQIKLSSVQDMKAGDVLVQVQQVPVYTFNALLAKLDFDPGVGSISITSIGTGATPLVTTVVGPKALGHNLSVGNFVTLTNTSSTPEINGTFEVLTVPSPTTFTIAPDDAVTIAGSSGTAKLNYALSLPISAGGNVRDSIVDLAAKLDTDPNTVFVNYSALVATLTGTITAISATNPAVVTDVGHGLVSGRMVEITGSNSTPTIDSVYEVTVLNANTFSVPVAVTISGTTGSWATQDDDQLDQLACFNAIIGNLNNDTGVGFSNYSEVAAATSVETIIVNVNIFSNIITLNEALTYVQGELTIYRSIPTRFSYAPLTMQDPWSLKHMREATMMFANKAFSTATMSFASDLQPAFIPQQFRGMGPGLFGSGIFGNGYFGGGANSAPFRTYVPRQCQRCRYLLIRFDHQVARERYAIYGITLTGETAQSSRAYR